MMGSPTSVFCPGLRGLPGHRTVSAKIKKSQALQNKLVTLWPRRRTGVSLNPDAGQCLLLALGEAWLGFLA